MPFVKSPKQNQPLWKEWDRRAQKEGQLNTFYSVNGDHYTGEWHNNTKHGKGAQFWKKTGALYDGDWKNNKRCGFGTLSIPNGNEEGEYKKVYAGGWKNDKRHGHGTNYYTLTEYYEGEWYLNKRSGWGRMYYADGSIYEGEWLEDKRNGHGMLRLTDENRYEGQWKDGMKHGEGKFYHYNKGQVFLGTWLNDVAKCGTMEDFNRETAIDATKYPLPELELEDPKDVLGNANESLQDFL
ncbi:MORN repeat-containing protein 3-like [Clytia hemisphaerica]|uniref:MORN repeat-containing protein 3 n=1 Tax=Clytia hemisphaerica TaxID=252671 RepID=A0A7M5V102_9CNID|eukprot:TCONS_00026385-protein